MAQWIKCLPCKHEDWCWNVHIKFNLSAIPAWKRWRQEIPTAIWLAGLTDSSDPVKSDRHPASVNKVHRNSGRYFIPTSGPHKNMHTHTCEHNTFEHTHRYVTDCGYSSFGTVTA